MPHKFEELAYTKEMQLECHAWKPENAI